MVIYHQCIFNRIRTFFELNLIFLFQQAYRNQAGAAAAAAAAAANLQSPQLALLQQQQFLAQQQLAGNIRTSVQ